MVCEAFPFNRTIVELKFIHIQDFGVKVNPFNRTIVELKYARTCTLVGATVAFNRTIVELKYIAANSANNGNKLLTEP